MTGRPAVGYRPGMDGRQALRRLAGLPTLAVDGMLGAAVAGVQLVLLASAPTRATRSRSGRWTRSGWC
jgi:hypothetical protein